MSKQQDRSSSLARQQQRITLVQALAAASVANSVTRIERDWVGLAASLEDAMRGSEAGEWLSAAGTFGAYDLERFLSASASRPQHLAAWDVHGSSIEPYVVLDLWTPYEVLGMLGSPVSLEAWRMLASRWLSGASNGRSARRRVA